MDISSFLKLFTKGQKMELTCGKKLILLFILNENVWFLFHWCKCKKGYVNSLILWEIQTILCSFSYKNSQTPSLILILILEAFPKDVWNVIKCETILVSQQIYKFLVTILHIILSYYTSHCMSLLISSYRVLTDVWYFILAPPPQRLAFHMAPRPQNNLC